MTLVTDFVGWLAQDAAAARHGRAAAAQIGPAWATGSLRKPQAHRPRNAAVAPEPADAVVPMGPQRERRILLARRFIGIPVFDASGAKASRITDLSIEKRTGRVVYALIGIEGGLGLLRRLYPIPWALLRHDAAKGGYVAISDTSL